MSKNILNGLISAITLRGRRFLERAPATASSDDDIITLADAILSRTGEASGAALGQRLLSRYKTLNEEERTDFFLKLLSDFGPDNQRIDQAITTYQAEPSQTHGCELHAAAEPRRQELIRRLNRVPGGTSALVGMRADLIGELGQHPEFIDIDHDFSHLLVSWFNRGFLVLEKIDWSTPAVILDKIIRYEAVHKIHDWEDLRRRVASPDRRCYGFFHPALVDEPLIFVEIALTSGIPDSIAPILTEDRTKLAPGEADTAVFYSISNCQKGLKGISFGNFLIKQVVEELALHHPNISSFVTLSPAPTFLDWLRQRRRADPECLLGPGDLETLEALDQPGWHSNSKTADALKEVVLPLAAYYYLHAKREDGQPIDPVARFHLGNGARLERINWLGDLSDTGLEQAGGLMVNYLYQRSEIEDNHEAFFVRNEVVASNEVRAHVDPDWTREAAMNAHD